MRVLAADDDESLIRVLDRWLRMWGYEALVARSGVDAWTILKRADAARIAILDWDMPGLSGLEVCRLLRGTPHGADVYVLMLTGRQDKDDLILALEAGADDFLSKPFHPRELQLRLAKGISLRESRTDGATTGGAPPTGTTLGGKYRLERKIADGGMATVWLGVHLSLGVNVAIKFMKPELAMASDVTTFEREARAAAQLRNEHIVRVYDHGTSHDGLPYLVMEYLAGESLAERVDRTGPLSIAQVSSVVDQIARALTEAHGRGIIHRDVKPENILMFEEADRPHGFGAKLIDFGLANARTPIADLRATNGASGESAANGASLIAGTPSYMSPEYLRGEVAPSPALDLWALAATAFVAMTGRVAFDGNTLIEVYERACTAPLPVPSRFSNVPPSVDAWFARACDRRQGERYATATELAFALRKAAESVGKMFTSHLPATLEARDKATTDAPTEPDPGGLVLEALPTRVFER